MRQSFPLSLRRRQEGRRLAKRKRNSFAKVGMVCVVLMVALGLTGVGYAAWSEVLDINATVKTGTYGIELINLSYSEPLSCSETDNVLHVDVSNAVAPGEYDCTLSVSNSGTIPVRIHVEFLQSPADGVTVRVTDTNVPEGDFEGSHIDSGASKDCIVHVCLAEGASTTFDFNVTFDFVQWNL